MVNNSNNLGAWATKFSTNITRFNQALEDFEKSNVEKYLKTVFKSMLCYSSLDSMYKVFRYYTFYESQFTIFIQRVSN